MRAFHRNANSSVDECIVLADEFAWGCPMQPAGAWPESQLRRVGRGSAGVVIFQQGYGPYLFLIGTSPLVVDSRPMARVAMESSVRPRGACEEAATRPEVLALPIAEQVREMAAALSLNKSQLAAVLRVSRPTLYDWLAGKEPNPANSRRLAAILRLLVDAGISSTSPLNARFVRQAVLPGERSLLELLSADPIDEAQVSSALREAKSLSEEAAARRLQKEARLRERGFEELSVEQRREQLARNIALRDWPKE
ncbi:MAG: helix-turn-helix domain-containing protein [Myxococcales bacterium]|jgi:DNA-binding transcriptional regulator YiaG